MDRGFEPDVNRTRNLLIWSQTRYHCATDPVVVSVFYWLHTCGAAALHPTVPDRADFE